MKLISMTFTLALLLSAAYIGTNLVRGNDVFANPL